LSFWLEEGGEAISISNSRRKKKGQLTQNKFWEISGGTEKNIITYEARKRITSEGFLFLTLEEIPKAYQEKGITDSIPDIGGGKRRSAKNTSGSPVPKREKWTSARKRSATHSEKRKKTNAPCFLSQGKDASWCSGDRFPWEKPQKKNETASHPRLARGREH